MLKLHVHFCFIKKEVFIILVPSAKKLDCTGAIEDSMMSFTDNSKSATPYLL